MPIPTVVIEYPLPGCDPAAIDSTASAPTAAARCSYEGDLGCGEYSLWTRFVCRVIYPPESGATPLVWSQDADHTAGGKWGRHVRGTSRGAQCLRSGGNLRTRRGRRSG